MGITRIQLTRFTGFDYLDFKPCPGINILIGSNGTGKTHLMKIAYAACNVSKTGENFAEKTANVFLPSGRNIGRLVKRKKGSSECYLKIKREKRWISMSFSNHTKSAENATIRRSRSWVNEPIESVYIPVKEMLANSPGFLSLNHARYIHFEEVYSDILFRAHRPYLRGPLAQRWKDIVTLLEKIIQGKINVKNEEFFLRSIHGNLEFSLLAEGIRKIGLLWILLQNGAITNDGVLFWDEPETNLNPTLLKSLVEIFLMLQRLGVQIFLATHNYVVLKEIHIQSKKTDKITYHSFFRRESRKPIECNSTNNYYEIAPFAINDAYIDLYDRQVSLNWNGE